MSDQLFLSFQRGYLRREGTPLTDDIVLFDSYDQNKKTKFYSNSEWRVLDYKNIPFPPKEEKFKLPNYLYLVFKKKQTKILFNYIEFGSNVKIVS